MMNTDRSLAQDYFDKALEAFIRAKELVHHPYGFLRPME